MGNKEAKELVIGLLKLSKLLAEEFKDGVQVADFAAIMVKLQANPALKQAILDAYEGIELVPAEVKDLDLQEGLDILVAAIPEIMALIGAVKK